jgi:hypothetical protein
MEAGAMGDLLRQGCDWLARMRGAHLASQVTYRRPAVGEDGQAVELALNATSGQPDREVEDQFGIRVGATMTDFLIAAADFEPTFGEPQAGDQVVADRQVYEVLDLAGQGHWRWSGPAGFTMRIHTKRIGAE